MAIANGAFRTPPVVANLLIINILVFLAEILLPGRISNALLEFGALSFWKGGDFHIWQPLTYMFLHANFGHIFFNMFALPNIHRANILKKICQFRAYLLQYVRPVDVRQGIGIRPR